jgi:hypothetical protein
MQELSSKLKYLIKLNNELNIIKEKLNIYGLDIKKLEKIVHANIEIGQLKELKKIFHHNKSLFTVSTNNACKLLPYELNCCLVTRAKTWISERIGYLETEINKYLPKQKKEKKRKHPNVTGGIEVGNKEDVWISDIYSDDI